MITTVLDFVKKMGNDILAVKSSRLEPMPTVLFAVLGLVVGVVVNRVADNFTCERPFLSAPRCPNCSTPRRWRDQSALLRLLMHRKSCAHCGAPVKLMPVALELASAVAFAYLWLVSGATIPLLLAMVYTTVLLSVLIIDFQHRLIPNAIILPAIALAVIASPLSPSGPKRTILGGVVTFGIVLLIYFSGKLFERVRGYHIRGGAFGQGDVTLASFVGLVTAFPAALSAIVYALLLGGIGAVGYLVFHGIVHRRLAFDRPIPYGPFFCIAGWFVMVQGAW